MSCKTSLDVLLVKEDPYGRVHEQILPWFESHDCVDTLRIIDTSTAPSVTTVADTPFQYPSLETFFADTSSSPVDIVVCAVSPEKTIPVITQWVNMLESKSAGKKYEGKYPMLVLDAVVPMLLDDEHGCYPQLAQYAKLAPVCFGHMYRMSPAVERVIHVFENMSKIEKRKIALDEVETTWNYHEHMQPTHTESRFLRFNELMRCFDTSLYIASRILEETHGKTHLGNPRLVSIRNASVCHDSTSSLKRVVYTGEIYGNNVSMRLTGEMVPAIKDWQQSITCQLYDDKGIPLTGTILFEKGVKDGVTDRFTDVACIPKHAPEDYPPDRLGTFYLQVCKSARQGYLTRPLCSLPQAKACYDLVVQIENSKPGKHIELPSYRE